MLKKAILLCAMILLAGSLPSYAQRHTQTGDVYVRVVRVGFILGAGGGEGNLTYGGRVYPFSVSGISIGTIGASSADLTVVQHKFCEGPRISLALTRQPAEEWFWWAE